MPAAFAASASFFFARFFAFFLAFLPCPAAGASSAAAAIFSSAWCPLPFAASSVALRFRPGLLSMLCLPQAFAPYEALRSSAAAAATASSSSLSLSLPSSSAPAAFFFFFPLFFLRSFCDFSASAMNSRAMRCALAFTFASVCMSESCLYGASFFRGMICVSCLSVIASISLVLKPYIEGATCLYLNLHGMSSMKSSASSL
mmetsp:Transcript_5301/g.21683  ORF Transcript_5301/g.21683 Transcript_5301/m.21683 type:complete len:201 (+) Transcript_5301:65-667(+)